MNIKHTDTYSENKDAHTGDYVLYVGPDAEGSSPWKKNCLVQWTENGWIKLEPERSENTGLRSRLRVGAGADGIQIDGRDAIIQSYNFNLDNRTGWKIDKDGNAYFNNGNFKGRIEADEGWFAGELDCGNLQVRHDPNSMRRFPASGDYAIRTQVDSIRNTAYDFMGINYNSIKTFFVDDGYRAGNKIRSIEFNLIAPGASTQAVIFIRLDNGSLFSVAGTVDVPFWFQIGNGEKK